MKSARQTATTTTNNRRNAGFLKAQRIQGVPGGPTSASQGARMTRSELLAEDEAVKEIQRDTYRVDNAERLTVGRKTVLRRRAR